MTYHYYYVDGQLRRITDGTNTTTFYYDESGRPFVMNRNGSVYYYVTNEQGDVLKLIFDDGTVAAEYEYDAYGNVISTTGVRAQYNPLRYRGYLYDSETGFYYLQSRYYDPRICRFINADSQFDENAGFAGLNLFTYCANSPVIYEDQDGEALDVIWDIVSFGTSFASVMANPSSPTAWFELAADTACLIIPGLTGGGSVVRFITGADKLKDAAKLVDDIIDAGKAVKSSRGLGQTLHELYMTYKKGEKFYNNRALSTIFEELTSRLRPDAVDKINHILYELKPYNRESFLKAIRQIQKYLDTISEDTSGWYVVIDMYIN